MLCGISFAAGHCNATADEKDTLAAASGAIQGFGKPCGTRARSRSAHWEITGRWQPSEAATSALPHGGQSSPANRLAWGRLQKQAYADPRYLIYKDANASHERR
ncbi:hypothetical protein OPT61_g7983 [Boeremia exigua]|uniref:Uncharacterized protein n=1 Tax=Boeremia exigua TaxID=749465 RepID=A0ACC2I172_9PLEO|nr:hypothetical protein OPT61_g7983 [Boeremia exigua]